MAIQEEYIAMVGNFGTLKIKKHFSELSDQDIKADQHFYINDCNIPKEKRTEEQKRSGLCEVTNESLPYTVSSLLFKRGSREVYAIPTEQTIILDTD
jgi:hypothetical protein